MGLRRPPINLYQICSSTIQRLTKNVLLGTHVLLDAYLTQKAPSEDEALIAMAGSTGLEPATSDVTGRRSNQTELTPQAGNSLVLFAAGISIHRERQRTQELFQKNFLVAQ